MAYFANYTEQEWENLNRHASNNYNGTTNK